MNRKSLLLVAGATVAAVLLSTGCRESELPGRLPAPTIMEKAARARIAEYWDRVSTGEWQAARDYIDPTQLEVVGYDEYREVHNTCYTYLLDRQYSIVHFSIPVGNETLAYVTVGGYKKGAPDKFIEQEWRYIEGQWYLVIREEFYKLYRGYDLNKHIQKMRQANVCE